jgi:hypothetical protein
MASKLPWSWSIFFDGFWRGFGPGMALFSIFYVCLSVFADTSLASFESAIIGLVFAMIVSAIWGYDKGESAIREWRETRTNSPN